MHCVFIQIDTSPHAQVQERRQEYADSLSTY